VCAADWADLVALLEAVPRVVTPELGWEEPGLETTDPSSGISFLLMPDLGEPDYDLPPLTPGCAEGPGAEPEAAIEGETAPHPDFEVLRDFKRWLGAHRLSNATVDKHTRNAASFLAYMHGVAEVPLRAIHEFDLRDFLFDWIHRRSGLPATVARAAPASLGKLFRFLGEARGIELPRSAIVLGEKEWFAIRAATCPGGPFWDENTQVWIGELTRDLHARVMLPSEELGEDDAWGERMGPVEWRLHRELRRRWLLWRDELVHQGVTVHDALRAELEDRQRAWEAAPNERADGRTPTEAVRAERREQTST